MPSETRGPGEFALIARYFAPLAKGFAGAYCLRDDAAVIAPAPGRQLVVTTDAVVAGVHFNADDPADLVARNALQVNLSDLAAKGAEPRCYLLALLLPTDTTEDFVAAFCSGLAADQRAFDVRLIGGDTNTTPGPLAVAITALGEIDRGRMLPRGGARPGDVIFVTGSLGDAALGLAVLQSALAEIGPDAASALADRYRLPEPRVSVGARLIGVAGAAVDVSDGLVADLGYICEVSNCAAVVEAPRLPPLRRRPRGAQPRSGRLEAILAGGDDYEILFTAPPEAQEAIDAIALAAGVAITPIGRILAATASPERVRVLDAKGAPMRLAAGGWTHF